MATITLSQNTVQADRLRQILAPWKATVELDPSLPQEAPLRVVFDSANDQALQKLSAQGGVGAIEIANARLCTAKGFSALKALPHLRQLKLEHANLTPASLQAIAEYSQLRHLSLIDAGLNDNHLTILKSLRRLEHLNLSNNPKISDNGLKAIAALERLRSLHLAHTAITDKGLQELKALDALRTLNVVNTLVTQEALEQFADAMPNLRNIRR
ncbi:MAG: hypothetical protein NZU63_02965 [Gemmataceae bacterium]|nr:hypothetical protein [Gemmataceae bacterium]MDW8241829.1 hypothetical protein [Thermogemmata sp.]